MDSSEETGADLSEFLTRALHLTQDAGGLVLDFVEQIARNPALLSALSRGKQSQGPVEPDGATQTSSGGHAQLMGVEIVTRRPAQAWAEMHPSATPFTPQTDALRSADGQAPPLAGIQFMPHPSGKGLMLRIEIPDDQPAGTYSGVVLDVDNHEPRGTVCVRIAD